MLINLLWDPSVTSAPAGFQRAIQTAANILDQQITNNISVSINVGWGENAGQSLSINSGALATAIDSPYNVTYNQLVTALKQQAQTNATGSLTANLLSSDPTGGASSWQISTAEAMAFGLIPSGSQASDGSVGFANDAQWNFNSGQGITSSQFDLVSTALHELTHALGRINYPATATLDTLNLYTYSAANTLNLTGTGNAYFSLDGGKTSLGAFDLVNDSADWLNSVTDSFGGGPAGVPGPMSVTDWQMMQALGFQVAPVYVLFGPTTINAGSHDYLQLSTLGVAMGTTVPYQISGIGASELTSGMLTGTLTVGQGGTAVLDMGLNNNVTSPGTLTVTLGNQLASYTVNVSTSTNNVIQFGFSASASATGTSETVYGNAENDILNFSGKSTDYSILSTPSGLQVQNGYGLGANGNGTDTLINVYRLHFSDISLAFDMGANQSAGECAEILGAAFGPAAVSNATYAGIGLKLFDSGQTMSQVAQLALSTGLVSPTPDNTAFVTAVWNHLTGTTIDANSLASYTGLLNNGSFTQASLLALAASANINQTHIGLAGLATTGLDYIPA